MAPKVAKTATKAEERPRSRSPKREEPKAEEKFQEPDAKNDNRPQLKEKVRFETADTTMNVVQTLGGNVLTSLTDGGMNCLLAGARANVGQKAGRYMFEANILQVLKQSGQKGEPYLKIGFSTSSSSLVAEEECVFFDSEGAFYAGKQRQQVKGGRFVSRQIVAVVLNLDSKSPNFNTVALYRDGVAVGQPLPLPDQLKEKPLFPHVIFRNVSVATNFGPTALKELPFKCRMAGAAAASDCTVTPSKEPKDGKYEVMLPVAFPDEGTFDWVDTFLEKNPHFVEISDRKILQWASASGIFGKDKKTSNDKPDVNFGLPGQDATSLRRVLNSLAPLMPRNYLIMEVKSNLLAADRQEVVKRFNYPCYKKIAHVVMGEPNKEYKALVQNKFLKEKQSKAESAWRTKTVEAARKKAAAQRTKEFAKLKKENEKKRKAALEEKKAKEAAEKGEEYKKEEEAMEEDEKEDEEMEAEAETEPPVVELDEEEKKMLFPKRATPDLTSQALNNSFSKFSTPEAAEGFDDIRYEWSKGSKAEEYLKKWVMEKKLTTRIDDIKPGQAFKEKLVEFEKLLKGWQEKHAASQKLPKKAGDAEDVDIFSVTDISDTGKGKPLFANFTLEDWELVKLKFEFGMLLWSFKKDTDGDRAGIPLEHLGFYFTKYFNKSINTKKFGASETKELLGLIKDTVTIKDNLVVSQLTDDIDSLDIFVKLTEEHRRERARRIEAGDETARLKFTIEAPKPAPAPKAEAAKPAAAKPAAKPLVAAPKATVAPAGKVAPTIAGKAGKGFQKGGKW